MITDPVSITLKDTKDLTPFKQNQLNYSTEIGSGYCPGDFFTVDLPPELAAQAGNSYVLPDKSGATVANMTVDSNKITVTLSDFILTHQNVKVMGYVGVQIISGVTPGESTSFTVSVNGIAKPPIPVTIVQCPDCNKNLPDQPSKFGSVDPDGNIFVTIQTSASTAAGQTFSITDNLTSPGQEFVCADKNVTGQFFTKIDDFGNPSDLTALTGANAPVIVDCTTKTETVTVTSTAKGQAFRVLLPIKVTDPSLTEYTDTATVSAPGGPPIDVTTTATRAYGGGSGSGTTPPVTLPVTPPPVTPPVTTPPVTTPPATSPVTTPPVTTPSATSPVTAPATVSTPATQVAAKPAPASLAYTGLPGYGLLVAAGLLLVGGLGLSIAGTRRRTR